MLCFRFAVSAWLVCCWECPLPLEVDSFRAQLADETSRRFLTREQLAAEIRLKALRRFIAARHAAEGVQAAVQGRSHDGMEAPGRGPGDSPLGGPADVQHFSIVCGSERSQRREGDSPTRTAQQCRKKDRRRALGIKEGPCPEAVWVSKDPSKLSLMEKKSVKECTSKYYNKTFDEFMDFCMTEGLPTESSEQLDLAGDDFMDFMFLEGARSDIGEKLIAALKSIRLSLAIAPRRSLARLRRAVTGFRKAAPPRSRVPLRGNGPRASRR